MRKLYPHHLIFSPHPQCLPASSLIITLNSLCQTECWVRMREQMSFQNAAPLSLPLLSNCRKAEKEGRERGKHWYPPRGEEGLVVGTRPICIIPAPPPQEPAPQPLETAPSSPPSLHTRARAGVTANHRILELECQRQTNVFPIAAIHRCLTTCTII